MTEKHPCHFSQKRTSLRVGQSPTCADAIDASNGIASAIAITEMMSLNFICAKSPAIILIEFYDTLIRADFIRRLYQLAIRCVACKEPWPKNRTKKK